MKHLTFGNAYYLGFLSGIVIVIGLNLYSFNVNYRGWDSFGEPGIPFSWKDGGDLFANINWFGLIADIVIWVILSFTMGLVFQLFWSKLSARYLK